MAEEIQEPGFKLDGEFYPWVESYDIPTTVVVEQVTGMTFQDWAEHVDEGNVSQMPSTTTILGLMAAAIHQKYRAWPLSKIRRLLTVDMASDSLEVIGATEPEEEQGAEVVQLPHAEAEAPSEPSSQKSTDEVPPPVSAETPPSDSGDQTSARSTA